MDVELREALTQGFGPDHRLGIGEGTVKSHSSRGLASLERALLATNGG